MSSFVAIYLNNPTNYEVLYFKRNGKFIDLRSKDYLRIGTSTDLKNAPFRKSMTLSEVRFYLDNLKYLFRKDTHPCTTMEIMSGIYPSVIITPGEFTDTVIDSIMHSLEL